MRFVAVHCVPESVAEALESTGHEVLRLRNQMAADAPDPGVIEQAQRLDAVLLSLNGDFSDIVRYPHSGGACSAYGAVDTIPESPVRPRALSWEVAVG
jgi:predicted nuclease of predicted toxin-antitoxin system